MTSREILDAVIPALNDSQIFDLARNAAAPIESRKFAAEKLLAKGSHFANKAEISGLIEQIKQRSLPFDEVTHESETTEPDETDVPEPTPALRASFTTDSIR